MALQVLHILWTYLFLRILWRIATESPEEASRKEYEGGSDSDGEREEPAVSPPPGPGAPPPPHKKLQ